MTGDFAASGYPRVNEASSMLDNSIYIYIYTHNTFVEPFCIIFFRIVNLYANSLFLTYLIINFFCSGVFHKHHVPSSSVHMIYDITVCDIIIYSPCHDLFVYYYKHDDSIYHKNVMYYTYKILFNYKVKSHI